MKNTGSYLETAHPIGAEICRDALWFSDQCNWLGDTPDRNPGSSRSLATSTLGANLYSGTIGVAVFLAHLSKRTNESWFAECALGAARLAYAKSADLEPRSSPGFYDGLPGIAYGLIEIGHTLDNEDVREMGNKLLTRVNQCSEWNTVDIIYGAAGVILGLSDIRERFACGLSDDLFEKLGSSLQRAAEFSDLGCSWATLPRKTEHNLTGFAHGVAGIVTSLARLKTLFATSEYDRAIADGLAYEEHWYDESARNWPDFRQPDQIRENRQNARSNIRAWCHGAPGILLSRLALHAWGVLPGGDMSLKQSLTATDADLRAKRRVSKNFSLCHGLAGNAEILLYASRLLPDHAMLRCN